MLAEGQVDFEKLANKKIGAFLSGIPASGAALLVFNGPEMHLSNEEWLGAFCGKKCSVDSMLRRKNANGRSGCTNPTRRLQLV